MPSHFKNDLGQTETDAISNEELKRQLQRQPVGAAMVMTSRLQMYTRGVLTEEFLKCSDPK